MNVIFDMVNSKSEEIMRKFYKLGGMDMPHIIVKLWPGRNDEIKSKLSKRIANTVAEELNVDMGDVSVAIEEVPREEWGEKV